MRENWIKWSLDTRAELGMSVFFAEHKAAGYGLYLFLIESLYRAPGGKLPHTSIGMISSACGLRGEQLEAMLTSLFGAALLVSDGEFFWNPGVLEEVSKVEELKQKHKMAKAKAGMAGASRRWQPMADDGSCHSRIAGAIPGMADDSKNGDIRREEKREEEKRESIKKIKPLSAADIEMPLALNSSTAKEALDEWLTYKRQRRESYATKASLGKLLTHWAAKGEKAFCEAVDRAMRNNWAGLHEDKGPIATTRQTLAERNLALSFAELQKIEEGDI